jgi:hypothetical protein
LLVRVESNLNITLEIPTKGSLPRANIIPIPCYINMPKSFVAGVFFILIYYTTNAKISKYIYAATYETLNSE